METRITHSLIKAVSGEFDLENVFKLSLTRMSARPSLAPLHPGPTFYWPQLRK